MSRPDGGFDRRAVITRVTDGTTLRVPYQDVRALARDFDLAGERARTRAGRVGAVAASPRLVASSPLSPPTAAAAEAALSALAVAMTAWAAAIGRNADSVRRVASWLEVTDDRIHAGLRQLTAMAAWCYGHETDPPEVRPTNLAVPGSSTAPTGLPSLVDHAGAVNGLSDDPRRNGTIEIQTLTAADGRRRHIVYLPGVDDWSVAGSDDDVRDLGAAAHLASGRPTAYGTGVIEALRQAGVAADEPVLLVGHSEGGMQAVEVATRDSPYDISDVVTLGSPSVPGQVPPEVEILALEHAGDPVPLLDAGAEGPAQTVSVTFDSGLSTTVTGNHVLGHYSAGAVAVAQSTDPVLQQAVDGLSPFFGQPGDSVDSSVLQITRGDRPGAQETAR